MVLRNGRPNDILSVSRDARANSTSQSTALFPTVILADCATLAICIGKSRCPFDAMRCASCHIACSARMHACMHACSLACAYDFRPQHSCERKTAGGDERRCKINIRPRSYLWKTYETRGDVTVFLPPQIVLLVVDLVSSTSSIFS